MKYEFYASTKAKTGTLEYIAGGRKGEESPQTPK